MLAASLRHVIFMLVLIVGSWAGAPALGQSPNPSEADLQWVAQHLAAAMDSVIPLRGLQHREFVAYRMSPDFDQPESHFAISFPQTTPTVEHLEATVSTVVGGAVRSQLLKQRMPDRNASLAEIMLRVGIRRTRLTPDRCPALKTQADAFAKVSITIPTREHLSAHAPVHEIVFSRHGTHIRASSQDPGTTVVRWAIDTLNALNKCAGV